MENGNEISEMKATNGRGFIMGCACVITSDLTPEQIRMYQKYRPESLVLADGNSGEEIFRLDMDDSPGMLNSDQAVLSRVTTAEGKATITIVFDPAIEDRTETFLERCGTGLTRLIELERRLTENLEELNQDVGKIRGMVTRA